MIDKDGKVLIPSMFEHYRGKNFKIPTGNIFREVVQEFYFFMQAATMSVAHFKKMNSPFDAEVVSEDWDLQLWASRNYNVLGLNEVFASYRWLDTSIGRRNWSDEKIHLVLISHIKMLLNYFEHPKNTKEDKAFLFNHIWKIYNELSTSKKVTKSQKISTLLAIFNITRNLKLLPVISSVFIFSRENFAKKFAGLK